MIATVAVERPWQPSCGSRATGVAVKVAVTLRAADIVTTHAPAPLQAWPQPANVEPLPAAAVSVTAAPLVYVALHVAPHAISPVEDVTRPVPVPARVTVSA